MLLQNMCYFVTAILPATAELDSLRRLAHDHTLNLIEIHNQYVEAQLQTSERYYLTTFGSCDCGTILGSFLRSDERLHAKQPKERDIAELRRRGWSESKIKRWLSQQAGTASRAARTRSVYAQSDELEADHWQKFLSEVLASRTAYIGLLLHWYRGSYCHEQVQISHRFSIPVAETTPDFLTRLSDDVLYVFTS